MGGLLDILKLAIRGGFKSSEFWLSVLALIIPLLQPIVDKLTGAANAPNAPAWLYLVGAVVAAAYSWARAHVKATTAQAAADAHATGPLADAGAALLKLGDAVAQHVQLTPAPPYPGTAPAAGGGAAADPAGPTLDAGRAAPSAIMPEQGGRFAP